MRLKKLIPFLLLCIALPSIWADDPTVQTIDNPWLVLRSFLVSYPDKISALDYDGELKDWYLTVGQKRFYWAKGRLLAADQAVSSEKWRPYVDYLYPDHIPDPSTFSEETVRALDAETLAQNRSSSPVYNISFYDALYDGGTRRRIESHIVRFDYLGARVSVHEDIVPNLRRIETRLYELAVRDKDVRAFISSISSIEGYNWREIADSPSRSNHSWGIAVDILPKNWGKKNLYWNWVSYWNDKWMLIPLSRRWMPPEAVVEVFESEGFIWGGKWLLWDNMHFEYRPELLALRKWGYKGDLKK